MIDGIAPRHSARHHDTSKVDAAGAPTTAASNPNAASTADEPVASNPQ